MVGKKLCLTVALTLSAALLTVACQNLFPGSGGNVGAGAAARDYLTSAPYQSLVIEIQAVQNYAPQASAQTQLVGFLQARLNKPNGISVVVDPPLTSPGKTAYSVSDISGIESANRVFYNSGTRVVAYFLFLDGASDQDQGSTKILGQAYGPSSMVIFEKSIQSLSGGLGQPTTANLEATIMMHEFGHLLGLVNNGSAMQRNHQDTPHGAHCTNTSCLMYYITDTSDILSNILGGVPPLDADCLNDLRANGGK